MRGIALFFLLGIVGIAAAADFVATGSMTTPRFSHSSTLLPDGRVLVAGGKNPSGVFLATAELYDPASGSFAATGGMREQRYLHSATLLAGGKVLITGGFNSLSMSLAGAELYDPATGSFTFAGSMTEARYAHTATRLADGRVLIAGGFSINGSAVFLASAELYDPATGTFTPAGNMTSSRFRHTATLLADGRVLLAGGFGAAGILASAELYDPATGRFSATGSMSEPRYVAAAAALADGKVLVTGGLNGSTPVIGAQLYDPSTGGFGSVVSMNEPRHAHTATLLADGTVLVAGGRNAAGPLASAELYDPASGSFIPTGDMTAVRQDHTATRLATGRVLVTGSTSLASAELYTSALPPVADAGSDQSVHLGQSATLSGAASSDAGGAPLTYTWTLEAKPAGSSATLSSTGGVVTSLHPDVIGQYVISLVVDNGTDASVPDSVLVDVSKNLPPVARALGSPVSGDAPLVVLFDGSASSDPEGGPLKYSWDFGDASPADAFANPNHAYTIPGRYTALLTVTDDFGNTDQASVAVNVTAPNTPPTVGPTASPSSGGAPLVVQFTANALDPEGAALSYAWDFGDGSPGSTLANPSHIYAFPGVYTANVMVTDGVYLVNGATTVSVSSALAVDVSRARVKFGKPGKVDDKVTLEAKFIYPGTPAGVIRVVFDGVPVLEVPFRSFARERKGKYEYRARNVYAKLDLNRGTLEVSRHRMLLTGVDNKNGIDVVVAFGASVATDRFVMHEQKHHGERSLHYKRSKDRKKHSDNHRRRDRK